jgi:thiol-disulfide isomerase/thioredoxin
MRKALFSTFLFLAAISLAAQGAGILTLSPEFPTPGETVKITYHPGNSPLKNFETFYGFLYLRGGEKGKKLDIDLTKQGDTYVGEITSDEDTELMIFHFTNTDEDVEDNNSGKGYISMLYAADRKTPVQGALYRKGYCYMGRAGQYSIDKKPEKALKYVRKEFAQYPTSRQDLKILGGYSYIGSVTEDEEAKQDLLALAAAYSKAKKEEDKLYLAYRIYDDQKLEKEKERLGKLLRRKYPKGDLAKRETRNAFYEALRAENLELAETKYREYLTFLDLKDEGDADQKAQFAYRLAKVLMEAGDMEKVKRYMQEFKDSHENTYYMYELLATEYGGKKIDDESKDLSLAEEYSSKALEMAEKNLASPREKPSYLSPREYKESLKADLAYTSGVHSIIQYKLGEYEEALHYHLQSKQTWGGPTLNWYETHATIFEKVHDELATVGLLEQYIREGHASQAMKDRYVELFTANHSKDEIVEKYLAELEKEANQGAWEKLKKKMLDEVAPDFSLVNLEGDTVSLSELRGKVVILDFWATWCGPCKASFPAMQEALEKTKGNDQVVFLFINSGERGESNTEEDEKVRKFIEENDYTFNVPMDYDDIVINSYKVRAIPTKIVIGPEGQIRFKSVGFMGSNEAMVKELMMMVDMVKEKDLVSAGVGGR